MNMTRTTASLFMCLLISACVQKTSDSTKTTLLYQNCQLCHSNKELQRGPILDGQDRHYTLRQLQKFKSGQRGQNTEHQQEALMGSAVNAIASKDFKRISSYIASLNPKPYQPSVRGSPFRGETIYKARCAACHGHQAEGRRLMKTGSLAVLEDWYLLTQLRHFKHGRRGVHPQDTEGQVMAKSVLEMSDQEFIDVVTYISATFGELQKVAP